jgi:uncharacterized protein YndB with AHSA1/START domain
VTGTREPRLTLPGDEHILITRELAAPAAQVWRAWTTPELVQRWWPGRRGAMALVEIDLRVGGRWRYVMRAHGDVEVAFHGEYRAVEPERRIVATEVYEGAPGGDEEGSLTSVTFTPLEAGGTLVEQLAAYPSKAIRDAVLGTGMERGAFEQLDVLEEVASSLA